MTFIHLIVLYFGLNPIVNGNHFLGGTITWRPLNTSATGTPIPIIVIQTYSWVYSDIACTPDLIANHSLVPSYAGLRFQQLGCIYNCLSGSTGYYNISVIPYCTDFSVAADTTVGQRLDIVYLEVGDDFAAAFREYSWRPLATDSNAAWSIGLRFIIKPRSDTGLFNNAPVATVMSPINIPYNKTIHITIPIADADGDVLRCRWSTKAYGINECGQVCPPNSLPPNTSIYPNCTIIITGRNLSDWYAIALMVEDFIDSSSTTALSSVPVQFLVHVIAPSSCTILPEIVGVPTEQSCISIPVGHTFTSQLIAKNYCGPNVTIVDISTLSFSGMISSNITGLDSITYYKTLKWTPTADQLGYQVMCAMAFDSENSQSAQYCFKFYVSENQVCSCPGEICSTTSTVLSSTQSKESYWPMIGSVIALLLCAALTFCSCLCWYYFCRHDLGVRVYTKTKTTEVYHIQRCIASACQCRDTPELLNSVSLPCMNYSECSNFNQKSCNNVKHQSTSLPNVHTYYKIQNPIIRKQGIETSNSFCRKCSPFKNVPLQTKNIMLRNYGDKPKCVHLMSLIASDKTSSWAFHVERSPTASNVIEDPQKKITNRFKGTFVGFVPRDLYQSNHVN